MLTTIRNNTKGLVTLRPNKGSITTVDAAIIIEGILAQAVCQKLVANQQQAITAVTHIKQVKSANSPKMSR